MHIVTVLPVARGIPFEELSYFAPHSLSAGSVVIIPFRSRQIRAIVMSSKSLIDAKGDIKEAPFALKKIISVKDNLLFPIGFIEAAMATSHYYCAPTGEIINALTPASILSYENSFISKKKIKVLEEKKDEAQIVTLPEENTDEIQDVPEDEVITKIDACIFQAGDDERLVTYKRLVRESFAKHKSVYLVAPTVEEAERLFTYMGRGITEYVFLVHGDLTNTAVIKTYKDILNTVHPVLIVGTRLVFSVAREDVGLVILDKEASRAYKLFHKPFIDVRYFAEQFAKIKRIKLIFGGSLLRPELFYRYEANEFAELQPSKFKTKRIPDEQLIDVTKSEVRNKREFESITSDAKKLIEQALAKDKAIFLLVGRKGNAPLTVCADCGNAHLCPDCGKVLTYYKNDKGNYFRCHSCGYKKRIVEGAEYSCSVCGSWRLTPLGIGIEKVRDEVTSLFPKIPSFVFDDNHIGSEKEARAIIDKWRLTPKGILLGTEMTLPYLPYNIDTSIIITIDAFFAIPEFRMTERMLALLIDLKEKTDNHFAIQTRIPEEKLFSYVRESSVFDFYQETLQEREMLEYPPYKTFIKINIAGKSNEEQHVLTYLHKALANKDVMFSEKKDKSGLTKRSFALIRESVWPNTELKEIIRGLPSFTQTIIDPESLLG